MKKNEVLLDAIGDISEWLISDAHVPVRIKRFPLRRALVLAAAWVLCFALAVTGMAAADVSGVYEILYRISPEIAQRLKPVRMNCESSGIRMDVVSANIDGNTAEVYIALQDRIGNRLDETVDLFDSYEIRGAFDYEAWCRLVSYSEESRTATFLVEITSREPIREETITFTLGCLLTGKREFEGELDVDLTDIPQANDRLEEFVRRGYSFSGDREHLVPTQVLVPDELLEPTEGVAITGVAYVDDLLHVQVRYSDIHSTDNHGGVWLRRIDGKQLFPDADISFWGENGDSYDELVFDISPEELGRCELWGQFVTSNGKIDGDWEVTFSLKQ